MCLPGMPGWHVQILPTCQENSPNVHKNFSDPIELHLNSLVLQLFIVSCCLAYLKKIIGFRGRERNIGLLLHLLMHSRVDFYVWPGGGTCNLGIGEDVLTN